ncbi:hypothetical protein [Cognatiyoonia sp. IB215182]|uniref:COG3904 family protein n=1 Tax=Cognatiyoonia sp. IB215182 TaxID=3097353 RepID=UPI002A119A35|nr:hypothetical protein [Cognatiyoonia sp. IB215182]MDX8350932.1 hypothetical protein [Cognatiyoonia sp. IB215182]
MIRTMLMALGIACSCTPIWAQKYAGEAGTTASKFTVDGAMLIYDSGNVTGDAYPEIDGPDVDQLRTLLRRNPDITTLQLTSTGGLVWAGNEMAHIVLDFGLDTVAEGECSSSCVTIFLAGEKRSLTRGSRLGFHQNSWSEAGMQSYFKEWREDENWDTAFDFASWVYQDTQHETAAQIEFMIDRGVDPLFAIETKMYRPIMWFPSRRELEAAGILRD